MNEKTQDLSLITDDEGNILGQNQPISDYALKGASFRAAERQPHHLTIAEQLDSIDQL